MPSKFLLDFPQAKEQAEGDLSPDMGSEGRRDSSRLV